MPQLFSPPDNQTLRLEKTERFPVRFLALAVIQYDQAAAISAKALEFQFPQFFWQLSGGRDESFWQPQYLKSKALVDFHNELIEHR